MKRNNWLIIGGLVLCASAFVIFSGKGKEKQEVNAITVERTGWVANMAKPVVVNETINSTGKEVSSQLELRNALNDSSLSSIIINNDNGEEFNIPSGDYSKVSLVVNAPNSDITNQGLFKDITINAIASDTWIEKVNGNILILNAAAGRIVVPSDVQVKEILIVNKTVDSQFVLDIAGEVSKITVDSTSEVKLSVSGKVGDIEINNRASLLIEGTSKDSINITISEEADGTMITSGVELNVESASNADIVLKKGAEGSKVAILDETKVVEVTNNTTEKVIVKTVDDNNVVEIVPKKNGTINAQGQVVGTTTGGVTGTDGITPPATHVIPPVPSSGDSGTGNSGSSDSGSGNSGSGDSGLGDAQSSGNLTRIITRFETLPSICAGTFGESLLPVSSLNLPTAVIGVAISGEKVEFPILSWNNTNNYCGSSKAGNYYFTGVLGTPSSDIKYRISEGLTPTCRVYVKTVSQIEYYGDASEYVDIKIFDGAYSPREYTLITNKTQEELSVELEYYYYDENGYLIGDNSSDRKYYSDIPGGSLKVIEHFDTKKTYKTRKIIVKAYNSGTSNTRKLNNISFTYEDSPATNAVNVKAKNNSTKIIGNVEVELLYFDANGKVLGRERGIFENVYAPGNEETLAISYPYEYTDINYQNKAYIKPTSYIVCIDGAKVISDGTPIAPAESGIEYYGDASEYVDIKIFDGAYSPREYTLITNKTQEELSVELEYYYYDENGYLIGDNSSDRKYYSDIPGGSLKVIEHFDTKKTYKTRKIIVKAYNSGTSNTRKLNNISFTYEDSPATNAVNVKAKNNSTKIIGNVEVELLYFDANGKVLGRERGIFENVYAPGNEETLAISYPYEYTDINYQNKAYIKPTSYIVCIDGAKVISDE